MNSSYKIALAASFAVCVLVIGYYTMQRRSTRQSSINTELIDNADGPSSSTSGSSSGTSGGTAGGNSGGRSAIAPPLPTTIITGSNPAGNTFGRQPAPGPSPDRFSGTLPPGTGAGSMRDDGRSINPDRAARNTTSSSSSTDSAAGHARFKSYTIKPGDNFHTLAKRLYGAERFWTDIAQANPSVDPIRLKVGQVIRLPASGDDHGPADGAGSGASSGASSNATSERSSGASSSSDAGPSTATSGGTKHTVRAGETLGTIAKKYYNSSAKWEPILRANRDQLDDPRDLQVGMTLTIPPQR